MVVAGPSPGNQRWLQAFGRPSLVSWFFCSLGEISSCRQFLSSVLLIGVAGRFKVRGDRARGPESFHSLRRFRQCVYRFRIRDSRVKGQALAHNELSQGHANKFGGFQPELGKHLFGLRFQFGFQPNLHLYGSGHVESNRFAWSNHRLHMVPIAIPADTSCVKANHSFALFGARGRTRTGTGFPPGDFLTRYGFRRGTRQALPLGSGLSLCRIALRRRRPEPSSLYTFPVKPGLSSGLPPPCVLRFPRI